MIIPYGHFKWLIYPRGYFESPTYGKSQSPHNWVDLGSIIPIKSPKQPGFGSLVVRALGDALPKAISLLRALDMCQVCTEAVHSVAFWTRVTSQDMCQVCAEAVHSVAFWTRVTSQVWTCVKYVPKQSIP